MADQEDHLTRVTVAQCSIRTTDPVTAAAAVVAVVVTAVTEAVAVWEVLNAVLAVQVVPVVQVDRTLTPRMPLSLLTQTAI
jgi:hypothetical protein